MHSNYNNDIIIMIIISHCSYHNFNNYQLILIIIIRFMCTIIMINYKPLLSCYYHIIMYVYKTVFIITLLN